MNENINPVFLALARPPMCYGVTQTYLIAIFGFSMILFEANYFEMLFKKLQFLLKCPNSKYYGAISFDL